MLAHCCYKVFIFAREFLFVTALACPYFATLVLSLFLSCHYHLYGLQSKLNLRTCLSLCLCFLYLDLA
jgi:hypothetical protein